MDFFKETLFARKAYIAAGTGKTPKQWVNEEPNIWSKIEKKADQYRAMVIAGKKHAKGYTKFVTPNPFHISSNLISNSLPGLGSVAQKTIPFTLCDEAEQIRRAGYATRIRSEYCANLPPEEEEVYCPQGASDAAQLRDILLNMEEEDELYAYETENEAEEAFSAGIPAEHGAEGGGECCAKRLVEGVKGGTGAVKGRGRKKDVAINDGFEEQVKRQQEARKKQEVARARMIEEREKAKEAGEGANTGAKLSKKSHKKGKGGRKHKK